MNRMVRRLAVRMFVVASLIILFLLIRSGERKFFFQSSRKVFSPSMDYPMPGKRNIFFVETSCAFSDSSTINFTSESGLVLSARVACALEAAARAHPQRPVFLAHTCPLDLEALLSGEVGEVARAVFALPNVFLWPVRFPALFLGSPLQPLVATEGPLRASARPQAHASHLLRFLLLWKYGGTFLDADMLVLRPFVDLHDFACVETAERVSAAALDCSWEPAGRRLAAACVNETLRSFDPRTWDAQGGAGGVVTRALRALCGADNVSEMSAERCGGVEPLPATAFFPVSEAQWERLFDADADGVGVHAVAGSAAVRLWAQHSARLRIDAVSRQPAAQLTRRHCPAVLLAAGRYL